MSMNDLMKSELFNLMNGSSKEITNEQIQNAYEFFVRKVEYLNQSEFNYEELTISLSFKRY